MSLKCHICHSENLASKVKASTAGGKLTIRSRARCRDCKALGPIVNVPVEWRLTGLVWREIRIGNVHVQSKNIHKLSTSSSREFIALTKSAIKELANEPIEQIRIVEK